jgi:hypothetical protein
VVGLLDRGAEDGIDPVAHERDQGAAVFHYRVGHLLVVAIEDLEDFARVPRLGECGEAADVAEEDGDLHLLSRQAEILVRLGEDLADHLLGNEARERVPHPPADECLAQVVHEQRPDQGEAEGDHRMDDRNDPAGIECQLRADEIEGPGQQGGGQGPDRCQPVARDRGQDAHQRDQEEVKGEGCRLEVEPFEGRGDRVGVDLRPRHLALPIGVGAMSFSVGSGADDVTLSVKNWLEVPRGTRENGTAG